MIAAICTLAAMTLWGMILCAGYQFFLVILETRKTRWARALCYAFGGFLCFFATALFLFALNGGEWGLYGFLFTVLGFFLYHRFLWRRGKAVSAGSVRAASAFGGGVARGLNALFAAAAFPFGKIVDKGVSWREKRSLKKQKDQKTE